MDRDMNRNKNGETDGDTNIEKDMDPAEIYSDGLILLGNLF